MIWLYINQHNVNIYYETTFYCCLLYFSTPSNQLVLENLPTLSPLPLPGWNKVINNINLYDKFSNPACIAISSIDALDHYSHLKYTSNRAKLRCTICKRKASYYCTKCSSILSNHIVSMCNFVIGTSYTCCYFNHPSDINHNVGWYSVLLYFLFHFHCFHSLISNKYII